MSQNLAGEPAEVSLAGRVETLPSRDHAIGGGFGKRQGAWPRAVPVRVFRFFQPHVAQRRGDDVMTLGNLHLEHAVELLGVHAEGEAGRIIVSGAPDIPGSSMVDKMNHINTVDDTLLKRCLYEPRGAAQMTVNLLVPPCREDADTRTMLESPQEDYTRTLWAVRSFQRPQKSRPSDDTVPVVSVDNVDASYGATRVLKDVSFDVHAGMTVAVVGESGSGKSTAARCITGLLPPTKGRILFAGEELPASFRMRSKHQLRQAQMIYQMADTALNPKVRISDIIGRPAEFYSGLKGAALKNRVDELLDLIELDPSKFYSRFPPELSGGQKQRIGIARALAAEPSFIICDEVTSALDQLVAEGILRLLDRLQSELDLAYMFITHDLATVRSIADEVVVMKQGRVVEQGPKDAMFRPPHHPYTDLLLSSVPEMDPDWLNTVLEERGVDNIGEAART